MESAIVEKKAVIVAETDKDDKVEKEKEKVISPKKIKTDEKSKSSSAKKSDEKP